MDLFSDIPQKETKAITVTQVVRKMKRAIESGLGRLWIEGEISNLKKQGSGHWYFSLKDEGSQLQCAMFNARRKEGSEALEDGAKVKVFAEATVYEARGQLQIIVEKVERAGLGDLQAKFEALKRKLNAEGLFDADKKQRLPVFPRTIGIVTSPTGAALQDILNILRRRAPWVQPVLFPVRVQGRGVEREIANAIHKLNSAEKYGYPACDLLIVGRGGGSLEDLWCFNEEIVARAISASIIPVISAVGHEIDFTIADFAADMRAPTPSAAAELAVPDSAELFSLLETAKKRMTRAITSLLREPSQQLDSLRDALAGTVRACLREREQQFRECAMRHQAHHPRRVIDRREEKVVSLKKNLCQLVSHQISGSENQLERLQHLLRTLGPESAFQRGFSITLDSSGKIVRSIHQAKSGDQLRTKLLDGEVRSTIR
ncbi:exodeoxyribonuclease VII large subunit [Luteolibacter algae]|uniref:Exodeoxyribonuclease 7 large subunit n=1 Tax=Luteolibacter algae TaxID=454151 RepID=A0ABW5D456_9BACT